LDDGFKAEAPADEAERSPANREAKEEVKDKDKDKIKVKDKDEDKIIQRAVIPRSSSDIVKRTRFPYPVRCSLHRRR
jgi:hypothetical protein